MKTNHNNIAIRSTRSRRMASAGSLTSADGSVRNRRIGLGVLLLIAALLATAFVLRPPHVILPLTHYVLSGARSPECVRTVVFRDESGSMAAFAGARSVAMKQLVTWSKQPQTLRPTDELAIIDFAALGKVAESTKTIKAVSTAIPASKSVDPTGTSFSAAILAMKSLPATKCRTSIIAVSDGEIAPLTGAAVTELRSQGVSNVALVLPGDLSVPAVWSNAFPYGVSMKAPANDAGQTATAIATALADSVGQRMVTR
jgi:hypothetical protein